MEKWTLIIEDTRYPLADISYEVFVAYFWKTGASDSEYEKFIANRGQRHITDFNAEALQDAEIEIADDFDGRVMRLKVISDTDL